MKVYPTKLTDGDKRHWVVNGGRALKMLLVALLALVLLSEVCWVSLSNLMVLCRR